MALGKSLWEATWVWKQVRTGGRGGGGFYHSVGSCLRLADGDFTQLSGKGREDQKSGSRGQPAQDT